MSSKFFLPQSSLLSFCISLIVITSSAAYMLGNDTDRVALFAFKNQISPDSERVLSSWNASYHFCEWGGVTCGRRHGRVIELKLDFHGLAGSISPYIGNLSFLRNLNLSNNMLTGHIPQEVGRLYRLQNLSLSNNSLSGPLPINLSRCLHLDNLWMDRNNLTGRIPEAYGSFHKLKEFRVHTNSLIGGIPASLGNLSSMESLRVGTNHLTGNIPDSLSQFTNLWFISVGDNMLSGTVPPSLFNISSLQIISLPVNHLEGNLPEDLGLMLPNLHTFFIGNNQFSGSIPISLFTNTSKLTCVSMNSNEFSGAVPVEIGKQKNLARLYLGNNSFGTGGQIDDLHFLTSLNNCTDLFQFDAPQNNLGGKLPVSITNLSNQLTILNLDSNKIFGSIALDIGNLKNLELLALSSNSLTSVIPMSIGLLSNLQGLYLHANSLSGQIPNSIGNLSILSDLYLSNNHLEGSIATNFGKCHYLLELYLDHNHLTGNVPKQVFESSPQLIKINLSHNSLVGSLPSEVGNLKNLEAFDVSENNISGQIPYTLGNCLVMEVLHLQGNSFHGPIPSSFGSLRGVQDVDISRNNLSGKILSGLENLPLLQNLNLSFNNFEGEVPTKGIFQNTSVISVGGNDRLCGGVTRLHLPSCPIQKSKEKRLPMGRKLTLGLIVLSIFVMAFLLIMLYLRRRSSAKPITEEFRTKLPRVSYKELYDATGGFSSEMLIGMGSYGSVFKGVLHKYDSVIAVKVFNLMATSYFKNFLTECEILRKVRHRNLLKIFTVCSSVDYKGDDFKALVFEFMSYGSLESWLHPTSNGDYPSRNMCFLQRLNIAIDIACALDYLHNHFGTPIVHCDLKPSNVLLNEDMVACLGDFGISKFLTTGIQNSGKTEESNSVSLRGTIGYIPPEYGMGFNVSTEGDVYSYGILILEMFTGKRPTDQMFNSNITLHSFCEVNSTRQVLDILDARLLIEETPQESFFDGIEEQQCMPNKMLDGLVSILKIGVVCSSEVIADRMEIKDVLMKMQAIKELFIRDGNDMDM